MAFSLTEIVRKAISLPAHLLNSQREHNAALRLNQNLQKAHNLAVEYATTMDTTYSKTEMLDVTINGEDCTAYVMDYDNGMSFVVPVSHETGRVLDIDAVNPTTRAKYNKPVEIELPDRETITIQRLDPSLNLVEYVTDSRNQGEVRELRIQRSNILTTKFSHDKKHKVELEAKTIVAKKGNLSHLRGAEPSESEHINSTTVILDWTMNTESYKSSDLRAIVNDDVGYWTVAFDREGYVDNMNLQAVYEWPGCPEDVRRGSTVYFNNAYPAHTLAGGATNNRIVEPKANESYSQAFKLGTDVQVDFDQSLQQILNYSKPTLVAAGRAAVHDRRKIIPMHRE